MHDDVTRSFDATLKAIQEAKMSGRKLDDAAVVSGLRKVEWIKMCSPWIV